MGRHSRKGNVHKVREYEEFIDVLEVNSLTGKMLYKYVNILNMEAQKRLLPPIQLKILEEEIKQHTIWEGIYRKDYTISIISPKVNIGNYRPLKLCQMVKEFQKYDNFDFYEAIQPINKNGIVIKEHLPYFKTSETTKKNDKKIKVEHLLKVSKAIIDTYGYCRQKDNQVQGFNWLRTTGEKAFDIINSDPNTPFKNLCISKLNQFDKEINSILLFSRTCHKNEYNYKPLIKEYCSFSDVNKIVSLIPIYRKVKNNESIKYFVNI